MAFSTLSGVIILVSVVMTNSSRAKATLSHRVIHFISRFVPERFREDWKEEWKAELRHRELRKGGGDLLRRSLGAFWDALAMQPRRLEDEMFQDLRYGFRMLTKSRAF